MRRGLNMYGTDSNNCVACGARIEEYGNHHCSPEAEKRKQYADRQAESQDYINRKPTEAMRINYGFYLLSLRSFG